MKVRCSSEVWGQLAPEDTFGCVSIPSSFFAYNGIFHSQQDKHAFDQLAQTCPPDETHESIEPKVQLRFLCNMQVQAAFSVIHASCGSADAPTFSSSTLLASFSSLSFPFLLFPASAFPSPSFSPQSSSTCCPRHQAASIKGTTRGHKWANFSVPAPPSLSPYTLVSPLQTFHVPPGF
jgi:hypothetical protein